MLYLLYDSEYINIHEARNKTGVETIADHTSLKKALGTLVAEYYLFSLIYSWSDCRYKAPTKTVLLKYQHFRICNESLCETLQNNKARTAYLK